ncbi:MULTISPECIES: carbohydrate kinase [unclassified Breznakia]|uniref:carbohydrate kinase family protein n=1 Tax=unclassified Breznakia TaxID=2623764 RepID=UPI00247462DD|nr:MULTISPECIES: carbohydrate kinase [unclassified Breznakia]MDH6365970.1 fructokinase [Breznakia sp. PH1-1]MDH6403098.1 fructokinase [Breznakia sp. PF1-11]MDH6410807.1 fructokinase [Breznakia sp. PFB1-11]MDH6413136.1 fructokinase [Breznakia sp. PFB1-14]MDH6415504.1 fructokinase [Breznakia sp. PFB1-4]
MKNLCAIGEALIDFIPVEKGCRLKDVESFHRVVGGAPTNVAGAVAKLGGHAKILSQVGADAFGDHIVETLQKVGVDTSELHQSKDYDTSLAFVSLAANGERDFSFYRKTAADLHYKPSYVTNKTLEDCGVVHFCSVSLVDSEMKDAHTYVIKKAIQQNILVSFDPNLRFSLWDDLVALKNVVHEYLQYADIVKISQDELEFLFDEMKIEEIKQLLFTYRCKLLIITGGEEGASIYRKDTCITSKGVKVTAVDTTGAGDSFIGAFLYKLLEANVENIEVVDDLLLKEFADFANLYAAHTVTQKGALSVLATQAQLDTFSQNL